MAADPFSEWPDTFAPPASSDPFAEWPDSFRKKPATLAALDDDGPNSSPPMDRPGDEGYMPPPHVTARRDMSQLGAGLRAAGAAPATTRAPETSALSDILGLDVMGDTLAGAGRTAVNTLKAIPDELNRGTSGAEASLGTLARATGRVLQARPPGASDAGFLGLGSALRAPGRAVENLGGEVEDIAGRQAEQADLKLKANPEADSIISRAVQGVPMLTGLAMTGGTAGATAGMGLLGTGGGIKRAEDAGATPGQAWAAGALQGGADMALGQLGSIPAIRGLLHGVPVEGAADAVLALAKQGGSGALQSIGMDVAHGLARKLTYAKDAGLDPAEMARNAAAQALLQGAMESPGIEIGGGKSETIPPRAETIAPSAETVAPFRGTWTEFLNARDMDRGDFAVLTGAEKKALRAEYEAALDAHREQAVAARAAAMPARPGILVEPAGPLLDQALPVSPLGAAGDRSTSGPLHPALAAAVDAVAPPRLTNQPPSVGLLDTPSLSSNAAPSTFPSEVFGRLVEGKPLRLAKSDLERDVGQAAKGLWPTGLLKSPADVQLLHDTLAQGGNLDTAVAALAKQGPQKAERFAPAKPAEDIHGLFTPPAPPSGTAVTEAGTEVPFRYRAVSADDLVASHDTALNVNPAYPAELQPRDRGRIASRLQIDRMVNTLDPERLGENRMVSQGAPVVGPDSIVESGNARTIALKRAYASGHPNGAAYSSWVRENAPRFGLDPATLPERPVLVRERLGDLGDRAGFAREANAQSLAGMSATEQAGVDAQRLTPDLLARFVPNGSGDVASAGNRDFVRGFLAGIPPHEAASLIDAAGQLSREGQARLHGALLAGAYQDPGLVSRMTEATDDNTRGLSRALAVEAPAFIGLRQGAERGAVHPGLDLGPDIATAANRLSELRASGQKVHDYLAQQGLFGSELSTESQRLLSLFDEFKRSPSRIAETLHRYVELATAAGDPRQASLTATEPPTKAELLERAATTRNQAGGLLPFEPSRASRPEPAAVVADHLAATVPPEHVTAFTPGDSGAVESPTNSAAVRETVAASSPVTKLVSPKSDSYFAVHPSAREPGRFQLTRFDGDNTPTGHTTYDTHEDAVSSATGKFVKGAAPIGNRSYAPVSEGAAVEGTLGWLLGQALGDQELAHRLTSSEDRTLSRLADPLASVAPSLAEGPPELRGFLRQAVDAYANTREEGGGAGETFYRGTKAAGQKSSTGITFATSDPAHAARYGDVAKVKWNGEGKVLDLRDLGAIADWEELGRRVEGELGPGVYDVIQPVPGRYEGRSNVSDVYSMLRQPGAAKALEKAGVGLVKVMQLADGGESEVAAILPKGMGEPKGSEVARLGRLLGADAPEEVHHIASFLAENAQHPESVAQYLHRVAELHQTNSGAGGEGGLSLSQLLEMAADREQRQAAGSVIPMESSNPVAKAVIVSPGEAGFVDLRGPRFGEASPIRRWFTREGKYAAMGPFFAERTKTMEGEKDFRVKATEKRVVANVRDYGTALRDQMEILKHADVAPPSSPIGTGSSIEDVHSYVRAGIMGENDLSAVGPPLQEAAAALRAHLTEQSRAYLQRPDLPASLKAVISENLDSYFPRTFERITDPKGWAKNLRKDFRAAQETGAPQGESWRISQAADWAQQQNPTMTREDAEGYAFKLLMDDPQAAYAVARGTQAQKAAMGTESRGNLKRRLGLPEELDNLLGLHQDPTRSYQIGAMRAARDLATYDLHSKVAQMGSADPASPDGLTPDGQRPIFVDRPTPDLPVRIGGKGPLAEKFTSEQVAAAIRGTQTVSAAHTGFMYYYLKVNGAIKTGKIAMNVPMGVARNMLTWPSLLLAGGHWVEAFPAKYAWETAKTLPLAIEANLGTREGGVLRFAKRLAYSIPLANGETVGDHMFPEGQKLADLRAEVQRKTELGVLGQSTSTDDLRYYTGMENEPDASSRAGKVIRDLGGIWSGEHDMGKDIVFEAERAGLAKANPDLSPDELDKWARDRMLATTPSRSEVSEGVRAIRAAPGVSPFPTFAAERFRNMKNNAMIAWEDLNSTNPQMKVLGAKRAAGLLTALAMAGGGTSWMLQKLWGTVKEDADALREFLPEYLKHHQIAVSDRAGGKIRYADISPLMPLTGATDPAMALLRGIHQGSTRDGMIDAAQEFARPFLDEEFALKTALDLRGNQQNEGNLFDSATNLARQNPRDTQRRQIYLPGGPPGVVAGQIGKYVWHQDAPAMGLEAERMARATGLLSNTNARGKRYTVADEMAALNGVRFNTIDMNAAITGVGYNLKDALTESKRYFTSERSSSQNDPKTVLDARAAANDRWKNAFEIGLKKVAAARQSGIADFAIRQNLRISGVPPLVIGQLMAGRFSTLPLRMPYRAPQDYVGAGSAPGDGE